MRRRSATPWGFGIFKGGKGTSGKLLTTATHSLLTFWKNERLKSLSFLANSLTPPNGENTIFGLPKKIFIEKLPSESVCPQTSSGTPKGPESKK